MILDQLKAYGWMAVAIAATTGLGIQTFRLHGAQLKTAEAVITLANERAAAVKATAAQLATYRKTEQSLMSSASETRKKTNEQIATLTLHSASLMQRVRNAQAAQSGANLSGTSAVASDGQVASEHTQPELLGSFGETDVSEASRADTIRLHLESCYRDYDRAEEALKVLGTAK